MEERTLLTQRAFAHAVGVSGVRQPGPARAAQAARASSAAVAGDELCESTAVDLATRLCRRDVSAVEVMRAHLSRIERINPRVNAIVTLVAERALADAARADSMRDRGETPGPLHGLPVAHKDLVETAGIRTTHGSLIYELLRAARDTGHTLRCRRAVS